MQKRTIMKRNNAIVLGICVVVTLFSLGIRWESIVTPRAFDYEWHTATVLRHLEIWHEDGGLTHHFVPPVTYPGESNKHINNHSSIEVDRMGYSNDAGDYYYVSYPPFAYIAPYALFAASGFEPNVVGLRIFNVLVQIATASILLLLLYRMTKNVYVGLIGFCLYLFTGISLYMHTVNYMSDMFVQVLFVLAGYLFYTIITSRKEVLHREYIALALTLALTVYSEWIGLFICAALFFYAFIRRRERFALPLLLMSIIIPIVVLTATVLQYASVSDTGSFLSVMTDRYLNGYVPEESEAGSVSQLLIALGKNYLKWFSPLLMSLVLFAALLWFGGRKAKEDSITSLRFAYPVLYFFALPVVLHHLVFLDWSAFEIHFYSVLKTVPLFCIIIPLCLYKLWLLKTPKQTLIRITSAFLFFVIIAGSLTIYALDLRTRVTADRFEYCNLGDVIRERTADDEVAFLIPADPDRFNDIISSVVILCAHRNVALYTTVEEASELMLKNGTTKGVLFTIDHNQNVIEFVKSEKIMAQP